MAENIMNSSEMREKSLDWNLACDVQLRKRLELTAQRFQQKALSLSESIKDLNAKSTVTAAKLGIISILFSISAQIHIFLYQEFSALLNLNPNDKCIIKLNTRINDSSEFLLLTFTYSFLR